MERQDLYPPCAIMNAHVTRRRAPRAQASRGEPRETQGDPIRGGRVISAAWQAFFEDDFGPLGSFFRGRCRVMPRLFVAARPP